MFSTQGYTVIQSVISAERCDALIPPLAQGVPEAGDRNVLSIPAIQDLARELMLHPSLRQLMPSDAIAIQCTLFDKSPEKNWLVALHQDLSIPVAERIDDSRCTGWSVKEGVHYTQPPIEVLRSLVAVRLHLDDCGTDNGPLRVVPGSHLHGRWSVAEMKDARLAMKEVECPVMRGGALVMSPLVLHASSKAKLAVHRRVLHFLFGPRELPCGLRWRLHGIAANS